MKLRSWLRERYPHVDFPSPSAIAAILKRRGLVTPPRRRRRCKPPEEIALPFPDCDAPNRLWCVDFKGWFLTHDGERCYPLTLSDAFSRYVLRCEALRDPNGTEVQAIFDSAFREFGLPDALRSDGGPPFASTGAAGLTWLSVWWLRLGLRVERIAPGKPQQNGRHERMHRTLKLEVEVQRDLRRQQRAFDLWRRDYNDERPHAALAQRTPARLYEPSSRRYPRTLIRPEPPAWFRSATVDRDGFIRLHRHKILVSRALQGLDVELEHTDEAIWDVRWGSIFLGRIDSRSPDRRIIPARRKRGQVSAMSLE